MIDDSDYDGWNCSLDKTTNHFYYYYTELPKSYNYIG